MVTTTNNFGFSSNYSNTSNSPAGVPMSENKDMFTKLLVAQIRNQDPLAPSDPATFVTSCRSCRRPRRWKT